MHMDNDVDGGTDTDITNVHAAYSMDKLMLGAEYVNIDREGDEDRSAYLLLADYDINDKFGVAVRYSQWESLEVGVNNGVELDRVTVAPNYAITDSLGAILEYSSTETAGGADSDQLALELTFTF